MSNKISIIGQIGCEVKHWGVASS